MFKEMLSSVISSFSRSFQVSTSDTKEEKIEETAVTGYFPCYVDEKDKLQSHGTSCLFKNGKGDVRWEKNDRTVYLDLKDGEPGYTHKLFNDEFLDLFFLKDIDPDKGFYVQVRINKEQEISARNPCYYFDEFKELLKKLEKRPSLQLTYNGFTILGADFYARADSFRLAYEDHKIFYAVDNARVCDYIRSEHIWLIRNDQGIYIGATKDEPNVIDYGVRQKVTCTDLWGSPKEHTGYLTTVKVDIVDLCIELV